MTNNWLENNVFDMISKDHIKVGDRLEFIGDTKEGHFTLSDVKTPWKVISVVPKIETSVCLLQTQKFNKNIVCDHNLQLITVSKDEIGDFDKECSGFANENHIFVSDKKHGDFGKKTRFNLEPVPLLCRAVIVLDKNNIVKYLEIPSIITNEPNYDALEQFVKANIK